MCILISARIAEYKICHLLTADQTHDVDSVISFIVEHGCMNDINQIYLPILAAHLKEKEEHVKNFDTAELHRFVEHMTRIMTEVNTHGVV